jgi:hypothetical protein
LIDQLGALLRQRHGGLCRTRPGRLRQLVESAETINNACTADRIYRRAHGAREYVALIATWREGRWYIDKEHLSEQSLTKGDEYKTIQNHLFDHCFQSIRRANKRAHHFLWAAA